MMDKILLGKGLRGRRRDKESCAAHYLYIVSNIYFYIILINIKLDFYLKLLYNYIIIIK